MVAAEVQAWEFNSGDEAMNTVSGAIAPLAPEPSHTGAYDRRRIRRKHRLRHGAPQTDKRSPPADATDLVADWTTIVSDCQSALSALRTSDQPGSETALNAMAADLGTVHNDLVAISNNAVP